MFGLSRIQIIIIAGLLGAVLIGGGIAYVFHEGKDAGSSAVTSAVQTQTIKTLDAARITKEKADEAVRSTPYGDRADGLR